MPVHGGVHAGILARTTGESQICAVPPLLVEPQVRGLIADLGGQAFCIPVSTSLASSAMNCAVPVDGGHIGSASWVTCLDAVPVPGRHQFRWVGDTEPAVDLFVCWSFGGLTTAEGAGHARGAGCGGAAVSGGAGGSGRGRGDRGGAPVWGGPADVARLVAPVCGRGWDREPGGPLEQAGVVPASDAGGGGGPGAGDPQRASGVGAVEDHPPAAAGGGRAGARAVLDLSGAGASSGDRPVQASTAAGGLPAVGTGPVDGAVADGRDGSGAAGRRRRGEGGHRDR